MSLIWLRIHQMILLSGYKHAFFLNWLANIHKKKWRTCAYVHHFLLVPCTQTHSLTHWLNKFLFEWWWIKHNLPVVLARWVRFCCCCSFFICNSITNTITAHNNNENWATGRTCICYVYSVRLSFGMHIENHSKCNLSSPSVCSNAAYILRFFYVRWCTACSYRMCVCLCIHVTHKNLAAQTTIACT